VASANPAPKFLQFSLREELRLGFRQRQRRRRPREGVGGFERGGSRRWQPKAGRSGKRAPRIQAGSRDLHPFGQGECDPFGCRLALPAFALGEQLAALIGDARAEPDERDRRRDQHGQEQRDQTTGAGAPARRRHRRD
jgi:hypothetical protein